jgi:hypothetical protein
MFEILILNLRPGTRDRFHQIYINESLPILKKWNIIVVAHGPSMHDENSYWVIRSFKSLEDRQKSEDAFYESDDWHKGPGAIILALIETSASMVITEDEIKQLVR